VTRPDVKPLDEASAGHAGSSGPVGQSRRATEQADRSEPG
jgi:hypothetical protein